MSRPARWAVVPGDPAASGPQSWPIGHRPAPATPHVAVCGQPVAGADDVQGRLPGGIRQCKRCLRKISTERKAAAVAAEKTARRRKDQALIERYTGSIRVPSTTLAEASAADAAQRRRERGTSIRTVRGGLPTLGSGR